MVLQTVGDAMSDMLLVESILGQRGWDCAKWDAMYNDLPNRQIKIKVALQISVYSKSIYKDYEKEIRKNSLECEKKLFYLKKQIHLAFKACGPLITMKINDRQKYFE